MSKLKNIIINDIYKVKHFIESTSFCDVYSATEQKTAKMLNLSIYNASKISRDDLDKNGDLKEIGFLGLGIEGFPKLIGFGDFNHDMERYRYIATEFISGESVMDRMKRLGPLSEFEATFVTLKIAEIANNLHNREKPILLNGLSLDNIKFDMSGDSETIKLRNLINVRYFEEEFKCSYVDGVSPYYLASECFSDVFTAKTDQYNIASLLFHMMKGVPPWYNEDNVDLLSKESLDNHLNNRLSGLRFNNEFDDHLKSVISKSLSDNSDDRFMSMSNFTNHLKRETILTHGKQKQKQKPIKKTGNGFNDVAGMEDLKTQLKTQVLDVLNRPDHFKKYGVTIPNGMLLYGPPGCGKTFISEKFCEEGQFNFILVKPSDLSSIYVSGGEEKIGELFKEAEKSAPTVICFDEVDAVMPKRDESLNQSVSARVNEFLAQINKCSDRGIFVIATTNKPSLIEEAILRTGRLEIQIYVPPPDAYAREMLFKLYLKNRHCEIEIDYKLLASLTEGIVTSDVEFIVNNASHKSAMLDVRISMEIIKEVIGSFRPSVSKEIIASYKNDHEKFTDSDDSSNTRTPIGFQIKKNHKQ